MNYCPALLNSCRGQSMCLVYSGLLICIFIRRGGSLSSVHLFTGRASLFMCFSFIYLFCSQGSRPDTEGFQGGTLPLVYYPEGCTSSLNPAHHCQRTADLDSFSVRPASRFTSIFSLVHFKTALTAFGFLLSSLLIHGIIISDSLMLMSSGWLVAKQQD